MNVEDNLDSDNFYNFWQLSGCAIVLCRNLGHISKITNKLKHCCFNNNHLYTTWQALELIFLPQYAFDYYGDKKYKKIYPYHF